MRIDWKTATIALLAAAWVHDAVVGMQFKKKFFEARADKNTACNVSLLLIEKLERMGADLDDFESIAINGFLLDKE